LANGVAAIIVVAQLQVCANADFHEKKFANMQTFIHISSR
jgi:hypothetical protein